MSDHFKNFDELFRDERDSSRPQRPAQQRPAAAQPAHRRPAQPRPVQPEGQRPARPAQPRPVQPGGQRCNLSRFRLFGENSEMRQE